MPAPIQQIYLAENQAIAVIGTTLNSADKSANITLSGGDLIATFSSASDGAVRSIASKTSGKYYVEFSPGGSFSGLDCGFGIALAAASLGSIGTTVTNACGAFAGSNPPIYLNGSATSNLSPTGLGTCVGMAADLTNKKIWFRNYSTGNKWIGNTSGSTTADPATNVDGLDISSIFPGAGAFLFIAANQSGASATLNAGSSAFSFPVPSGFTAGWPA